MEHILSALQIPYLAERGTATGGPEYGLLNRELGQESHLPELKVILIAVASNFHSCTLLFHLYFTRVKHLKHKCGLFFRLRAYQCLLITYKVKTPQHNVQGQPWPTYFSTLMSAPCTLCSTYVYCCSFPCFIMPPTTLLILYYCLCLKYPLVPSCLTGWVLFISYCLMLL